MKQDFLLYNAPVVRCRTADDLVVTKYKKNKQKNKNTPHFPMRNTPLRVKRPFLSVYNIKPLLKLQGYNFLFCL